ncbi:MAG: M4 family metallopeptidase, partial [Cystobacter sp.]
MRPALFAVCVSLSLTACGGPTLPAPEAEDSPEGIRAALGALPEARVLGTHGDGTPFMIQGALGRAGGSVRGLAVGQAHARVAPALGAIAPVFRLRASELLAGRATVDEQGHTHLRYARVLNGLPVLGDELVVHVDDTGLVYAANGSARGGERVALPSEARLTRASLENALAGMLPGGRLQGEPRLLYVRASPEAPVALAYEAVVEGGVEEGREHVFLDARDGAPVLRFPEHRDVLNRAIYSRANGGFSLVRSEGNPPTGDAVVDGTYDNLGRFYSCFQTLFGRDSYNGAGAKLMASVHYQVNDPRGYWDGSQIICGDGNGSTLGNPCLDPDVVIHELTHGVTESESGLIYSGEPGGLSEAMSDISAAFCTSWASGSWSTGPEVWMMGERVWTPSTPGDALRYLDDPFKDGTSLDYYPDYTAGTEVHRGSGIANLAFALLSKGGTHPRGKTSIQVSALGVEKAARTFYRAGTNFFTANTSFAQAKAYTESAATGLGYSSASVTAAWQAVGVGMPSPLCAALANGVAVTGLSGAAGGASCAYPIAVPVGASNLKIEVTGGTGDSDLYVKAGGIPTTSAYDCRPYLGGNAETCTFAAPAGGSVYYVVLRAFPNYAGVSLKASFTPASATSYAFPGLSGASGATSQLWAWPATAGRP